MTILNSTAQFTILPMPWKQGIPEFSECDLQDLQWGRKLAHLVGGAHWANSMYLFIASTEFYMIILYMFIKSSRESLDLEGLHVEEC